MIKINQPESHTVEYKKTWRDEYLKWICAFANSQGGTLYIGINDKGVPIGLSDAKKLMEDIPNKVKSLLGIFADVNIQNANNLEYLELKVEPYPYPISYKGQYHIRSGSTKQELTGASLDQFLLRKQGKTWDGVPVPHVVVSRIILSQIPA